MLYTKKELVDMIGRYGDDYIWYCEGMTNEDFKDILKDNGYPATERNIKLARAHFEKFTECNWELFASRYRSELEENEENPIAANLYLNEVIEFEKELFEKADELKYAEQKFAESKDANIMNIQHDIYDFLTELSKIARMSICVNLTGVMPGYLFHINERLAQYATQEECIDKVMPWFFTRGGGKRNFDESNGLPLHYNFIDSDFEEPCWSLVSNWDDIRYKIMQEIRKRYGDLIKNVDKAIEKYRTETEKLNSFKINE